MCEQMVGQYEIELNRLSKVAEGNDPGTLANELNWTGGGSFVSCELASCNAAFLPQIAKAKDDATLTALLWKVVETGYISHRVWKEDLKTYEAGFAALETEEKRKVLLELLDTNMLYVNRSDAADAESGLSDDDKAFTRSFYGE
jgi:adenine-specific DNA-methyltransferase